ncbi:unnamed protein product [Bubo scandiacus]
MGLGCCPPPKGHVGHSSDPAPGFTGASGIIYSEVTTPRRLEAKDGAFTDCLGRGLLFNNGRRKPPRRPSDAASKNLIAKDIPVFRYSLEGELITEFPYIQDNCYYEGFVEGSPGSAVSLSTCFGIRILQVGKAPRDHRVQPSARLYKVLPYPTSPHSSSKRPLNTPRGGDSTPSLGSLFHSLTTLSGKHFLLMPSLNLPYLLPFLFKVNNSSETRMLHLFTSISNLLNTVYKPMKLQIIISAMEMWTRTGQVTTSRSLARMLQVFAAWCHRDAVSHINYEHIQLLL